jgi:acyl-CoA synthetase (AMP-forming)/AMP-acid ligase II
MIGGDIKPTHITDYLERNAKHSGTKPALVFEGKTTTWQELWQLVSAASLFFSEELGSGSQKVAALLMTNSTDFVSAYLAVLQAGHIALPLDPAYKKLELDAIVNQIKPDLIISSRRYADKLGQHSVKTLIDSPLIAAGTGSRKNLRLPAEDQIASLTFTSGTSGRPKSVPNTHANHMWNIKVCSKVWDWTADDTLLISLPLSHWYGLVMGLSGAIYHGNTLYLTQQAFLPDQIMTELTSGRISMFTHVPLAYSKLLELNPGKDYDLSKVRLCISGGAALPPAVWQEFKDRFGIEIVETYGSSETGRIAGNRLSKKVAGSPGPALPEVNLKLSQENEVLVKSPGLFPGYYHNPSATKEGFTADGYWRTGDIAELKDGQVFLKGRVQERIRRFGYTVSPRDVEWAMRQNSAVSDIYVMGRQIPGQPSDELIYFIVTDLTDSQIQEYTKENLLFAWRPDEIVRLAELPRTATGKASLSKLKQLAGRVA